MKKILNISTNIVLIWSIIESSAFEFPDRLPQRNCRINEYRCDNGDCIKSESLCDGKIDCSDRSDETKGECLKPEIDCPKYAFRCSYGACVDGDKICNEINDCADGSDETLLLCNDNNKKSSKQSTCKTNQFTCANGQCIDETNLCDGSPDCSDRSDETETSCQAVQCEGFSFKCSYGACIDGDLKCNGVRNCADGSDEDTRHCAGNRPTPTPPGRKPTSNKFTTSTTTTRTTSSSSSSSSPLRPCIAPEQPKHGKWSHHTCKTEYNCENLTGDDLQGTSMAPGSKLNYSCDEGFKINGSNDVYCDLKGKWSSIPECLEIRCKALSSASTKSNCAINGSWTSCDNPVLPGTMADLSCHTSYRQDTTTIGLQGRHVKCNSKGKWQPEPIRCVPDCGRTNRLIAPTLIVNGSFPNITEIPWHATLYEAKKNDDNQIEKEFICGATIITENLLITAAHCVYEDNNHQVKNPSNIYVAAGNTYRDYDSPLHDYNYVQKRKINKIYVECAYTGSVGNYQSDIAILQVDKSFLFTLFLVPICLDTIFKHKAIEIGGIGLVAGFGRTAQGSSSFIIQKIHVPVVPSNQCTNSTDEYLKFLTLDKFCAGYTNGSSVCDGDSGGGLVFELQGLSYLRGIVSVGVGLQMSFGSRICDSYRHALYTEVSSHIDWIQDVIFKLKNDKYYPECQRNYHQRK